MNQRDDDHDGHDEQHDDRQLRARLQAADPASSLAPADPTRVARLLEAAMSETPQQRRNPLTWLAAAAAVVVIGGVALAAALGGDGETPPTEGEVPAAQPAVLTLEAPGAGAGRCMIPNARALAMQEVAFLGVVEEVGDDVVELTVEETYAGTEASTVEVAAPSGDLSPTVGEVDFREGERYLVSATDGRVTACGFSGPATEDLQALYDEAFAG
ncbi:hypothetical protein [Nocardioides sp. SYSU DS0663]|uniref:hypothetical protein n=1 Tax=Nocardioides sp. SYSU DS0663 TaxID=3416445 RepID=UPI003F4B3C3E